MEESVFKDFKIWVLAFHISLSSVILSYTLGVFNTCTDNVSASLKWGANKDIYITVFSSFITIGQTIGCSFASNFFNRYGRRGFTIQLDILFIIGSIILVIPNTITFGIGRFITGLATGGMCALTPIYISEVVPEERMARIGPLFMILGAFALFISYAFGLVLPINNFENDPLNNFWIFMFLFPALISAYQLGYFFFFLKFDTPQFYMSKNLINQAHSALEITHLSSGISNGLRRVNSDIRGKTSGGIKISMIGMILSKRFKKMIRHSFMLSLILQMSGQIAIMFYSTSFFSDLGGGLFFARVMTTVMGIAYVLSCMFSIFILKYIGRKKIIITGQVCIAVIHIILGVISGYIKTDPSLPALFIIIYFLFVGWGINTAIWLYVGEVLNDQIVALTSILSFAFSIPVAFIFPIAAKSVGANNCLLYFAVCMILTSFYCFFDLIETRGKEKEEILAEMKVIQKKKNQSEKENDSLQDHVDCQEDSERNDDNIQDKSALGNTFHTTLSPSKLNEFRNE